MRFGGGKRSWPVCGALVMSDVLGAIRAARVHLKRWDEPLSTASRAFFEAREGGPLALALAVARVASVVANELDPDPIDDLLVQLSRWKDRPDDLAVERLEDKLVVTADVARDPVIGKPSPEGIATRLRNRGAERGGLLLVGPTGAGKTTTARAVGRILHPGGRSLRVPGDLVFSDSGPRFVRRAVAAMQPAMVIIDDLDFSKPDGSHSERADGTWLGLLESLNGKVLTAITSMEDDSGFVRRVATKTFGACYYPGIRPGRVDLVVPFTYPDEADRRAILKHYGARMSPELVKMTRGLTGAYLRGLAPLTHFEGWEEEVRTFKMSAPRVVSGRYNNENAYLYRKIDRVEVALKALEGRLPKEG